MNYQNHYENLINRAKGRILSGYFEKHHIIPRCMGGTDEVSNIVRLTPEEHYVAHQLLVKMNPANDKLLSAAIVMGGKKKGRSQCNNKTYGWLKKRMSESRKGKPGHPRSLATREKMSIAQKAVIRGPLTQESIDKRTATRKLRGSKGGSGRARTDEEKKKISDTLKGRNHGRKIVKEEKIKTKRVMSQDQKDHLSSLNKGKILGPLSAETKDKISKSNSGKKRSPEICQKIKESLQNLPLHVCPHCGKESTSGVMVRWHFDNCKLITHTS